jgi:hypothetical protein
VRGGEGDWAVGRWLRGCGVARVLSVSQDSTLGKLII